MKRSRFWMVAVLMLVAVIAPATFLHVAAVSVHAVLVALTQLTAGGAHG